MNKILFIIRCQEDKYYLGLSNSFVSIFFRHLENYDNIHWLNLYKPVELVYIEHFFNYEMLNNCVLHYMYMYGINNVRGGIYSDVYLSLQDKYYIDRQINLLYNNEQIYEDNK